MFISSDNYGNYHDTDAVSILFTKAHPSPTIGEEGREDEATRCMIEIVSKCAGHLAPSLGVVELTIALHYVYNCPDDKITGMLDTRRIHLRFSTVE